MKMLKKLALVSAVSMISAGAFAMEAMDDETMSATTGQDGITINIVPDVITRTQATDMKVTAATMNAISNNAPYYKGLSIGEIRVHDNDGMTGNTSSGALVIGGGISGGLTAAEDRTVILAKGDKPIQINVDMVGDSNGAASGGGAMLNVEIKQPRMAIKLGNIYVADSYNVGPNGVDNSSATLASDPLSGDDVDNSGATDGNAVRGKVQILDGLEIVMESSTMSIQLGNESQGSMIVANATLVGGLTINNFKLYDQKGAPALTADDLALGTVGRGGNFRADSIKITDNGGTDLTAKTSIDFGSRVTQGSTVTTPATKDAIVNAKSGGTYTTYADAQAAGAAGAPFVAIADTTETLANGATLAANNTTAADRTWGGIDTYNGLVITSELGGLTGANIAISNAAVGDANAANIGDVQIVGLMLGKSKIVIMGH